MKQQTRLLALVLVSLTLFVVGSGKQTPADNTAFVTLAADLVFTHGYIYTVDAQRLGSIEAGKIADLVVLDRNIVELAEQNQADRVGETLVDLTLFNGKVVYDRSQQE